MAEADVHKQEFVLRNLQTRSVTLYPTKAQVVRDINGITLKPGANQITIEGLTPTADEHSVKVEGTGAATITDLSVQLVTNKEFYEDIYPSDDEHNEDTDDEDDESEKEDESTQFINSQIKSFEDQLSSGREVEGSAQHRLALVNSYGETLGEDRPENLEKFLQDHRSERAKAHAEMTAARGRNFELEKKLETLRRRVARLGKAAQKEKEKAHRLKLKNMKMRERKREEIRQEKARVKAERVKFWPKKVYKVVISLDAPSGATPGPSRRGSVEDLVKIGRVETQSETSTVGDINLSLSYITYSASWSPRYDLSLNSTTSSGVLDYCAELKNTTSETWRDARVVLSTSQTSYQGLGDTIPVMQPWNVGLVKGAFGKGLVKHASNALYSQHEQEQKSKNRQEIPAQVFAPRSELFGLSSWRELSSTQPVPQQHLMRRMQARQESHHQATALPSSRAVPALERGGAPGGVTSRFDESGFGGGPADAAEEFLGLDADTIAPQDPALLFEESSFSDSGLTTTYDVPTLKTLSPTSSTIKHKIARIEFKSVVFSHVLVPKLKAAAYLKAKLRNVSKIALLKGPAGLSLDGSFLGQSSIPRCSAGESFVLPLGVDPTISVSYAKPTVRRSQSGIFNKEDSEVFTRLATVTNTKATAAVDLLVLDQVPVSEDERLRIDIAAPRGLRPGGDPVPTGNGHGHGLSIGAAVDTASDAESLASGRSAASKSRLSVYGDNGAKGASAGSGSAKEALKWGSATATAKKDGEVNWRVKINPLRGCKLVLEYEATYPTGEMVQGMN